MLYVIILLLIGIIGFIATIATIKYPKLFDSSYKKTMFILIVFMIIALSVCAVICFLNGFRNQKIFEAEKYIQNHDYILAMNLYGEIGDTERYVETKYQYAIYLYNEKVFTDALQTFNELPDYKNSKYYIEKINLALLTEQLEMAYSEAQKYYDSGKYDKAYEYFNSIIDYKDSRDMVNRLRNAHSISVGVRAAVAIMDDGNIKHAYNEYNFGYSSWHDIISVAFIEKCVIGLKNDGTVLTKGNFIKNAERDWKNIVAVSAGVKHVVGLKSDGTVVADGINVNGQCNVDTWKDIVAIATGWYNTVGLDKYGNIHIAGKDSKELLNKIEQNKDDWQNIVAIAASGGNDDRGKGHVVGLRADGTAVAVSVGNDDYNQCDVKDWTDIVAIAAGEWHTVGLKSDGTVETTHFDSSDESFRPIREAENWTDIVEIAAGSGITVGLKSDGTIMVAGYNREGQEDAINNINKIGKVPPRQHWFDDFIK